MGLQDPSRPDILTVSCSDVLTKEIQTKLLLEECTNHRYRKDLPLGGGGGGGGGTTPLKIPIGIISRDTVNVFYIGVSNIGEGGGGGNVPQVPLQFLH